MSAGTPQSEGAQHTEDAEEAGSTAPGARTASQKLVCLAASACLLMLASASFVWFFDWSNSRPDVTAYWDAALRLRHGEALYGPPPPGISPKAYLYPPAFAVLFLPLTLLAPVTGYAVWMALHFVFLAVMVFGCLRLAGIRDARSLLLYVGLLVAWLPAPAGGDFQEGQANLLVACLVVVGLRWIENQRRRAGAAIIALAVHIKLLPIVLFAALLAQRRYRAVAAGAVATVALVLLPAVVTVPREGLTAGIGHAITMHVDYARVVLMPAAFDAKVVGAEQFYVLNNSLVAVLHRLFGDGVAFSPFPQLGGWHGPLLFALPRATLRLAGGIAGALLVAASLVFARRSADSHTGRVAAYALCLAAAELAALNCWEHHLVFVALMLAPLAAAQLEPGRRLLVALSAIVALLWTGPYLLHPIASAAGIELFGAVLSTVRTWGVPTLAVLALAAIGARHSGRAQHRS